MSSIIDYPNPVLSSDRDDYIENCKFDVSFEESEIKVTDEFIQIEATLDLCCEGLKDLIKQGKASVVVLINSSAAFFRKTYVFDKDKNKTIINIPKYNVKKNIDFCGYILANELINFSFEKEFNELYFKNASFTVKKADILAKGETRSIALDDSELEKPISSIFRIDKSPESKYVETDFETDEKIIIKLNEELNQLYYKMKDFNNGSLRRYLIGIIVYPVLVEAIAKICEYYRDQSEDYSEKRWFRAIEHKLEKHQITLANDYDNVSYTELADKLLGGIALDGLKSVESTINEEVNSGEYVNKGGKD